MYRLYFLCIMNAVVFGNSDEAKYIDLLPEEEKQEFLNRIARRIIEEIQSKDSPEQSHVEVSDDQLNTHHAYVQDLIKKESENLRSERSDNIKEHIEGEASKDEFERKDVAEQSNLRISEDSQHIDLTLRNNVEKERNESKLTNDSTFNVIPVKVLYDQENVESTKYMINKPELLKKFSSNSEQKSNISTENSQNISQIELINPPTILEPSSTEKEITNQSSTINTYHNSDISEYQIETKRSNDMQKRTNKGQTLTHISIDISTEAQFSTNPTLVTGFSERNKNHDDSFEYTQKSTEIKINSDNYMETNDNSATEYTVQLSDNNTAEPITLKSITQLDSNKYEHEVTSSPIEYVTTIKNIEGNLNNNTEINNGVSTESNINETSEMDKKKILKMNVGKKNLRQNFDILSDINKYEKTNLRNQNRKLKEYKNTIRPYIVYEVPAGASIFVQNDETKQTEQPYVVPIYNFAPKHAYYNAHNYFGVNNDEEDKLVRETPYRDSEEVLKRELYFRNGFEINLNTKKYNHRKDSKGLFKYPIKHPRHPHWVHIIDSKFEYNPNFIDYQENDNFKGKRDFNFKRYNDESDMLSEPVKISSKVKYIPLRQQTGNEYHNEPTRQRRQNKFHLNYKNLTKSEIKAIKTLIHHHKKFANLLSSPYDTKIKPIKKRKFDGGNALAFNNNANTERVNIPPNNIELDYYFGRNEMKNETNADDFDDEYAEIEEKVKHQQLNDLGHRKYDNLNLNNFRVEEDDCKHGCIVNDLEITQNDFDNYLETLVEVLKDMIYRDNTHLTNYDWLLSTVDIESAIKKLIDLTKNVERRNHIHPSDLRLLNYVIHLYNTSNLSQNTIQPKRHAKALQHINNIVNSFLHLLRRRIALPKNNNRKPGKIKNPVRLWYKYFVREGSNDGILIKNANVLDRFKTFLKDLQNNLFELHDALKHIASITTYANQNWYRDLKNIYLKSATKKQLLQVILHLAASKLFSSIEETAKSMERDELYINNNGEVFRRIQHEVEFVSKILKRMKRINQK